MNPLLKMLGGGGGNVFGQIMMQAIGSFMRGDPPPGMLEAYDFIHEWQMSHVAEVKSMLQLARE